MRSGQMLNGLAGWVCMLPLLYASAATSLPSYGTFVDTTCTATGAVPAKPFNPNGASASNASQVNCGLCHTNARSPNGSLTTAGDQFRRSGHTDVAPFCARPAANQPPVFTPVAAQSAVVGRLFELAVSARDPEGGMLLLSVGNGPTGSTFSDAGNGGGSFRWTPSAADLGAHTLTFHAADTGTPMAVATLDVVVAVGQAANPPPVLASIGNQQLDPGQTLAFTLSAMDPEGQTLSYFATGLPTGAQLVGANFSWTPDTTQIGQHPITFRATDAGMPPASDSEAVVISVGRINRPPVLATIGNRQGPVGSELRFALTATDPDGDPIVLSCTGLPAAATFTDFADGSGELVWLPTLAARADVSCSATDLGTPPESDSERFGLAAVDVQSGALPQLDSADWSQGEHAGKLRVRGSLAPMTAGARMSRPPIDVFGFSSDGSAVLLGSGRAVKGGRFRITLQPFVAPCSVAVGVAGVMGEAIPVRNAPVGCDTDLLTRARAELSCDGSQLRVFGTRGPVGGQVVVSDADGGERLASFPVSDKRGSFGGIANVTSLPSALMLSVEVGEASWTADEPLSVHVDGDECGVDDDEHEEDDDRPGVLPEREREGERRSRGDD